MPVQGPATPFDGVIPREETRLDEREKAARFYATYGPAVYRRCLRLLRDRDAARDATQEVFVKLLKNMRALEDRETALPWLYRVATNHCLNLRRERSRHGEEPIDDALEVRHDEEGAAEYPQRQLAQAVLARFDSQTQAVAISVLVDGMEHEEVANALGISRKTVGRKLARFLEQGRRFLSGGEP